MNEVVSNLESKVDANQRQYSFGAAAGSALLALQHIVQEAHGPEWMVAVTALSSAAAWMVFLFAMLGNQKLFKSPEGLAYRKQLEGDEILQRIQKEAFAWGFGGMLTVQVVMILLFSFFEPHFLTIPVAATSTMAAGIVTAVLRYQTLWSR